MSQTRMRNLLPKVYDNITPSINTNIADTDMSEDCLYLNVFIPAKFLRTQPNAPNKYNKYLPVMVHVHGYHTIDKNAKKSTQNGIA